MPNRLSRYCDGIMEAGWLLALVVTPLFFNVYSSRVFEPDKIALLRALALIVLAAWLIKLIEEGGPRFDTLFSVPAERYRSVTGFLRVPLVLPVGALVVIYIIATAFSVTWYTSLFGSYQRMQGTFTTFSYLVLFAALAANLRRRAQVERLFSVVILTSLPISLYGILQHYHFDPLPWGGDTVERVTGNMGNAIFIAAYLIMSSLITLGRVATTFFAILTEAENFARNMVRATGYVFIFAVNLVTIWYSGSRGPLLGLLAGGFFFGVLLALYWGGRWHVRAPTLSVYANAAALAFIAFAVVLAGFLFALNVPNGPLERLRASPGLLGRLGHVLDEIEGRTGTGQVRVLIAEGVVQLMLPHPPLAYPDGGADTWNAIRPLIGYGPEALYVAYNRFYPPELGQIEARNASPDRSHNETFDALAFTGLLGLGVYLALFVSVFYYSLKWLGFVDTPRRRNVLLALIFGGGLASAVGFVRWQGPEFFGIGLPFGMLLGLIAFLTLYGLLAALRALVAAREASPEAPSAGEAATQEPWRAIALISLFSAIVAHFTEIHFGIAIVSTRTHFWIFAGLLIVVGFVLAVVRPANASATVPTETGPVSRRRQRAAARGAQSAEAQQAREFWRPVSVGVGLMTAVLFTLGYDFISNAAHSNQALTILWEALAALHAPLSVRPYGVLVLILITWLVGSALVYLEEASNTRTHNWLEGLAVTTVLSMAIGVFGWLVLSVRLSDITARIDPQNPIAGILASADNIAGVLTLFYLALFVLVLALAAVLPAHWPVPSRASVSAPGLVGYTALAVAAVFFSIILNLQVIQADMLYKTALQLDDQGRPQLAIRLYDQVIRLAPSQDYYYLFLGRAFLNSTASLTDPVERDKLFTQAEAKLTEARRLNPLNTDHTANLGRINRQWAALAADPAIRAAKAARADAYYQQALSLSPHNAGLWNEWALLKFQLLSDGDGAQDKLTHSFDLDTNFEQTYEVQGNLNIWRAGQAADAGAKQAWFQKAIEAYQQGLEVATRHGANTFNLDLGLASAYAATHQLQPAIDAYLRVASKAGANQWQIYQTVAELYRQKGDVAQARNYGQLALNAAPDANKTQVQGWLNALNPSP